MEWMEERNGTRELNRHSNSTLLFTQAFEKKGLNPDVILQKEIENDPELGAWIQEKMAPKEAK